MLPQTWSFISFYNLTVNILLFSLCMCLHLQIFGWIKFSPPYILVLYCFSNCILFLVCPCFNLIFVSLMVFLLSSASSWSLLSQVSSSTSVVLYFLCSFLSSSIAILLSSFIELFSLTTTTKIIIKVQSQALPCLWPPLHSLLTNAAAIFHVYLTVSMSWLYQFLLHCCMSWNFLGQIFAESSWWGETRIFFHNL